MLSIDGEKECCAIEKAEKVLILFVVFHSPTGIMMFIMEYNDGRLSIATLALAEVKMQKLRL